MQRNTRRYQNMEKLRSKGAVESLKVGHCILPFKTILLLCRTFKAQVKIKQKPNSPPKHKPIHLQQAQDTSFKGINSNVSFTTFVINVKTHQTMLSIRKWVKIASAAAAYFVDDLRRRLGQNFRRLDGLLHVDQLQALRRHLPKQKLDINSFSYS